MKIKDIENLARLARIDLTDREKEDLLKDTEEILAFIGQVQEVEINESAEGRIGAVSNVMRDDVNPHEAGLHTEALLDEAPKREKNHVKVKKIL